STPTFPPPVYPSPSHVLLVLFFFYSYGDHRDLHSFPTRRSSDLKFLSVLFFCSYWPALASHSKLRHLLNPKPLNRSRSLLCDARDRKSTRLNSSHVAISYAVFCLKKKKNQAYYQSYSFGYRP